MIGISHQIVIIKLSNLYLTDFIKACHLTFADFWAKP